MVMVDANETAHLPAVQVQRGLSITDNDWAWVMGLGKTLPKMKVFDKEDGTFKGDFKKAALALRKRLGGEDVELGGVYDMPIKMDDANGMRTTVIVCVVNVKSHAGFDTSKLADSPVVWVAHEEFENACYKKFANVNTDADPCKAPDKNAEFNPFAPNPVGHRWFRGVTLFTKEVSKVPDEGVYLGIFKVLSAPSGFMVMVNEHNRITIPMIFLTETQLGEDDKKWMHGVRTREEKFGIDLLEGKQPNRGWLGPEMSG